MTAHSAVLCALLLCVPPSPTDGVVLCPPSVPPTAPATELPEPPSRWVTPPSASSKAPDANAGTGLLRPFADCVTAPENEVPGGGDAEKREDEVEDPAPGIDPTDAAPPGDEGEDGTEEPSSQAPTPADSAVEPEAEPIPEPSSVPSPAERDGTASEAATPTASPSPEPGPTENGTVSRASDAVRPTTPADSDQDLGERPPSKKVEEPPETDSVDGPAFKETSATSAFGRAVGVTSTTLLFLLAAGTLALRLAVGWPRFPPLYLGRRRLNGDLDTH